VGLDLLVPEGLASVHVSGITHDSRQVRPGDLYAALPGAHTHGARFAAEAAAAGAIAVLTDATGSAQVVAAGLPAVVAQDPRAVMGELAARIYGRPGDELLLIGVTGTNGKTTLTHLLEAALRAAGQITGVIGTVGTLIDQELVPSARTTPEATDLHALLAVMRERGVTAVAMEVSSHALVLGRVDGLVFDVAVFTNLSRDHLDFHQDMADYFAAKSSLFRPERAVQALVCIDDEWGERLLSVATIPVQTYAVTPGQQADWTVSGVVALSGGSVARAHGPGASEPLEVRLPGNFNVANGLGALAAAVIAGAAPELAADGIAACLGVPGRMERVTDPWLERGLVAVVDYAHTPDAVSRAVTAARTGARGRVLVVLGAGGDRDPDKRHDMGRAAAELADLVIVTDDNPRWEDPAIIRAAVLAGARTVPHATVVEQGDRGLAIQRAVSEAAAHDLVLILGKGHERGQEIAGVVTPFDDCAVLAAALADSQDEVAG
jgi:UDP-N-acetylmuramoyl-L-alanyl-D-glutamate--2,6-diaminopimelate ligase